MKRVIQLGMIWLTLIALGGCSMMNKQEESNIALSAEHEALCNSKNTLNKKLCRQTMEQLPKFESDINTYFKEKFHIDGFKLTGIHFPYDGFNRGGFNATFQLESDPYVMITDTFDYTSDEKYTIQYASVEGEEKKDAGKLLLASAIVKSAYFKTLQIDKISLDLETMGIKKIQTNRLYYGFNGAEYLPCKNLVYGNASSYIGELFGHEDNILREYIESKGNYVIKNNEFEYVKNQIQLQPLSYVNNDNEAKELFQKFMSYKEVNPEYGDLFVPGIVFYYGDSDIEEKGVGYENIQTKEVKIYE